MAICVSLFALASAATDRPTRVISHDFISFRVELTIDDMPNIHRLKILVPQDNQGWKAALDVTDFKAWGWSTPPRYYGISAVGEDVDIFTMTHGTANAQYYLHKYRVKDSEVRLVKSELVYSWSQLDSERPVFVGTNRPFTFQHDKARPWDIYLDTK